MSERCPSPQVGGWINAHPSATPFLPGRQVVGLALALGAPAALLLVAVWLGQLANCNAQAAQAQTRLAISRELAVAAVNNLQVDPERSVLLALHALATTDTLEARNALHQALSELHILRTIPAHSGRGAPGVAFSPDGQMLASIGVDGTAKVWEAASGRQLLEVAGPLSDVGFDIAFSPDGKQLATSWSSQVIVWDAATGEKLFSLPGKVMGMAANRIQFSQDGTCLAVANMDGLPKVWDVATHTEVFSLTSHTQVCDGIAFSPDGRWLATGDIARIVKIWDAASGQELLTLEQGGMVHSVTFSPDGQLLGAASESGQLLVWDSATGRQVLSLPTQSGLYDVAFMPDGKHLISTHQDGMARVWDVASGDKLFQLSGHAGLILGLAFSRDGPRLATASFDKFAKVWDMQTGQELMTLYGNINNVFGVSFSPDGKYLATAGGDGTTRVYTLETEDLIALARSRVTRALTIEECRQYFHLDQCPDAPGMIGRD